MRERTEKADVAAEEKRLVEEIVALQLEIVASGEQASGGESAETVGE